MVQTVRIINMMMIRCRVTRSKTANGKNGRRCYCASCVYAYSGAHEFAHIHTEPNAVNIVFVQLRCGNAIIFMYSKKRREKNMRKTEWIWTRALEREKESCAPLVKSTLSAYLTVSLLYYYNRQCTLYTPFHIIYYHGKKVKIGKSKVP